MNLIYYFIISMIGLSAFFLISYFYNNPLYQTSSTFKYPYFLSIQSQLISEGDKIEIFFSSLNNSKYSNLYIVVLDPFGNNSTYPIQKNNSVQFQFPKESNPHTLIIGNYSIILESNNSSYLSPLGFKVVKSAPLSSFTNFAFGQGIPLTIGLAVLMISTIFQFISTKNSDRNRQINEKSKWLVENAKYFFQLSLYSHLICNCFKEENGTITLEREKRFKVLFFMILFLEKYYNFLNEVGFYYFDDHAAEDFAAKLDGSITELYDCILGDRRILKEFFIIKKRELYNLKTNALFQHYSNILYEWLTSTDLKCKDKRLKLNASANENISWFYMLHFAYSVVINIAINDVMRINYSNSKQMEKRFIEEVKTDELKLKKYFDDLNRIYYENNEKKYYKHIFRGKDVFEPKLIDRTIQEAIKEGFLDGNGTQ